MSYCRFSSDDWQCDVYVYEDVSGGWTTHVAERKHVFTEPLPEQVPIGPGFSKAQFKRWAKRNRVVNDMVSKAELIAIGLTEDGKDFNHGTPGECAHHLEYLRSLGYRVPQYVIDELRNEALEISEDSEQTEPQT